MSAHLIWIKSLGVGRAIFDVVEGLKTGQRSQCLLGAAMAGDDLTCRSVQAGHGISTESPPYNGGLFLDLTQTAGADAL
jgi:hypothetical protein